MDTVVVARKTSHRNVYHTDKECTFLKSKPRVITLEQAERYFELPLCKHCANEDFHNRESNHLVEQLLEMPPDAI